MVHFTRAEVGKVKPKVWSFVESVSVLVFMFSHQIKPSILPESVFSNHKQKRYLIVVNMFNSSQK